MADLTAQESAFGVTGNGTDIYIVRTDMTKGGLLEERGIYQTHRRGFHL